MFVPNKYLPVQSQQLKHLKNVLNMSKVNNKDTRTTLLTSFGPLIVKFEHTSHVYAMFWLLTLNRKMVTE